MSQALMTTKKSTLYEKIQIRNVSVLFVCVGNACRSRMAEAFANAYGSDVLEASSAGLAPATRPSRTTRQVMSERQIAIEAREPRRLNAIDLIGFDLIVNLSGYSLPRTSADVIKATVADPAGRNERDYREVRDRIEDVVQSLIAHLREARLIAQQHGASDQAPAHSKRLGNHVRPDAMQAVAA